MGWLGKIIGGTIGFALGGPLGAVAGAVFGHAFDTGKDEGVSQKRVHLSALENTQLTFFVAAFSMLAKLVRANGRISKEEVDSIEKIMLYDLNMDPQSRMVAMNIFHTAMNSPESFETFASQFFRQFSGQGPLLEMMIDILFRVAVADGALSPAEERLIRSGASIFGFSDAHYAQLKSRHVQDTQKHYAVLGCTPADSIEDIKQRYRKLVSEYHPDKIASKGLPEEFMKFAHEKFRQIQEAYEAVKKERGFK
ncbi:MAG: co-chaperone DjlA [Deltaproteobacteria bacterium]|nr:co-chaperone DjlA [Deltaproteobacteria bacterium]